MDDVSSGTEAERLRTTPIGGDDFEVDIAFDIDIDIDVDINVDADDSSSWVAQMDTSSSVVVKQPSTKVVNVESCVE